MKLKLLEQKLQIDITSLNLNQLPIVVFQVKTVRKVRDKGEEEEEEEKSLPPKKLRMARPAYPSPINK